MNLQQVGGNEVTYGPAIDVNIVGGGGGGGGDVNITEIAGVAVSAAAGVIDTAVTNFPATQPVTAVSLPLPAGAATSANQLPDNHQVEVSNFPAVQPVSAATLPLPTGAATAANQLPDNHNVTVSNLGTTVGSVTIADGPNLDAFSRVRVSNPENIFSAQVIDDVIPTLLEGIASGTGVAPVFNSNTRMADLVVGAGTGESALQSYQYHRYQPGKSQAIFVTFVAGAAVADNVFQAGYFDAANGIFVERDGNGDLYFVRRTSTSGSVVDNKVIQANWSLNTLGSLNFANAQILVIDLQFLGMGRVRCGFDIDGLIVYCHEFLNANVLAVPYMQTASLPVRISSNADAAAAGSTVSFKCAAVTSEGGQDTFSITAFSTGEGVATALNGSPRPLLSIRPRATGLNGLPSRKLLVLTEINLINTGANEVLWQLVVGADITTGAWTDVATNFSNFEYFSGGTFNNLTNGYVVQSGYIDSAGGAKTSIDKNLSLNHPCSLNAAGANTFFNTFTILVTGVAGNSDMRCTLDFQEA